MHKNREAIDQQQAALMGYNRLAGNRFFSFNKNKRRKPDKFTEFNTALEKFKVKLFRILKIPQTA